MAPCCEDEVINLVDDDEEESCGVANPPSRGSSSEVEVIEVIEESRGVKRARVAEPASKAGEEEEEEDDEVVVLGTRMAARPVAEEVVEVSSAADLSGKAKEKLLAQLMAQNKELMGVVESLSVQVAHEKKAAGESREPARPGYWRRDGQGRKLEEDPPGRGRFALVAIGESAEGQSVARRFATAGMGDAEIVSIARCHNDQLWREFATCRSKLTEKRGGDPSTGSRHDALPGVEAEENGHLATDFACERYLFHGASPRTIDAILDGGIDFRLSLPTGAMGACAYFADQSSYSHNYCCMDEHSAESRPTGGRLPASQDLKMLLCRVLLGECARGRPGLRRPPLKPHSSTLLYDSVSNAPHEATNYASRGFMFGVFDNAQVYPEYVLVYRKPDYRAQPPVAPALVPALQAFASVTSAHVQHMLNNNRRPSHQSKPSKKDPPPPALDAPTDPPADALARLDTLQSPLAHAAPIRSPTRRAVPCRAVPCGPPLSPSSSSRLASPPPPFRRTRAERPLSLRLAYRLPPRSLARSLSRSLSHSCAEGSRDTEASLGETSLDETGPGAACARGSRSRHPHLA
eukprot:CAMPEP_0197399174 /NCGR_PEP_ID=MMETSP1165-20131217/14705_1 /TAXON_ID=284809 /ORGANISM="Chrysocystis fragilis, Strain CCMP3189" /LENGTH=575 /DNA_ID=CAMNT_0042925167 /DNA_START=9 /DNA_END=1733 /DNA_ORIENTATION=+